MIALYGNKFHFFWNTISIKCSEVKQASEMQIPDFPQIYYFRLLYFLFFVLALALGWQFYALRRKINLCMGGIIIKHTMKYVYDKTNGSKARIKPCKVRVMSDFISYLYPPLLYSLAVLAPWVVCRLIKAMQRQFMFDVTTQSLRMCEAVIENVICATFVVSEFSAAFHRNYLQNSPSVWCFPVKLLVSSAMPASTSQPVPNLKQTVGECSLESRRSSLACITQFTAAHAERIWHSIDTNICWLGCSSNANECHPGVRPAGCRSCLLCKFALRRLQGNVGLNIWPITRP